MNSLVRIESVDNLFDLSLSRVRAQVLIKGANADLRTLGDLHLDVARARRIVTNENRPEPRCATRSEETLHPLGQLHLYARRNAIAVK